MSAPPAFQFYASDFSHSTALLSAAATGAHIRMICHAWDKGPIQDHPVALSKAMGLAQMDPPFAEVWAELQTKWTLTRKGWICKRLERTRSDQEAYRERRRIAGQKGGFAKKHSYSIATASPELDSSPLSLSLTPSLTPSQTPPQGKIKPFRAKGALNEPEAFTVFYRTYPKHVDRAGALKAWIKLNPSPSVIADIHRALGWQIGQPDWLKENGRYCPQPSRWLNARRWEDEPFNPTSQDDDPNAEAFARVLGGQHGNR